MKSTLGIVQVSSETQDDWRNDPKAREALEYLQSVGANGDEVREELIKLDVEQAGDLD